MEKEQRGGLKEQIINSFRDLLKRNTELANGVQEAFEKGDFDAAEIAAALQISEGISRTVREVVESGKEHVIFSRDHISENGPLLPEIQADVHLERQDKPKTFGGLLILRLDKALPDGQGSFTRQELGRFTEDFRGVTGIIESQRGASFSREETIILLQKVLTTPGRGLDRTGEFERKRILKHFPSMRVDDFDEWSLAVGHDWSETPNVDFETAMQIRGLFMLEKLSLPPKTSA